MNIDGGTFSDLEEGQEVTLSINAIITEIGSDYIDVDLGDGDELTISEGSYWFIEL